MKMNILGIVKSHHICEVVIMLGLNSFGNKIAIKQTHKVIVSWSLLYSQECVHKVLS